jgi:hypothetical protein
VENLSFEAKWKLRLKYGIMLKQYNKKEMKKLAGTENTTIKFVD